MTDWNETCPKVSAVLDDDRTILGHVGPWTEDDYLALPASGPRIELLDGDLVASAAPDGPHQLICRRLANRLEECAPPETTVLEGVNLRVKPGRLLIPDVLVTYEDPERCVFEARRALLAAEVVSPSNTGPQWVEKHTLYASGGVPWYVLAHRDAAGAVALTVLRLDGDRYTGFAKAAENEPLRIPGFDGTIHPAGLRMRRP